MTVARQLPGHLLLRSVHTEADIVQYITFNTIYNNSFEGAASACLLRHHPETVLEDFWIVEDEETGQIVSTTCLIPWKCHFQEIELKVAQLEMVLTHPDYRGRGLVRAQIEQFHKVVSERGFDLSVIWGIPYFYRQFGYAYAIDGDVTESLPVLQIPTQPIQKQATYHLRLASAEDIPFLNLRYGQIVQELDFHTIRTEQYWHYLLKSARHPVEIIEAGQPLRPVGYIALQRSETRAKALECALPDAQSALALLQTFKLEQWHEISICWPETTPLVQTARKLGSQKKAGGQWLLRIPSISRLLQKMAPLFESRLKKAGWGNLSNRLVVNLYHNAYGLGFESGQLNEVNEIGFVDTSMGSDGGDLNIPPDAFTRLIFGYRTLSQLSDAWPDIFIRSEARPLVEILFPPLVSYLYHPYHYLGPIDQVR